MTGSRRQYLAAVAAAASALAGCGGNDAMRVTAKSVTASGGDCSGRNEASISADENRTSVSLDGAVPAATPCNSPSLAVYTTRSDQSASEVVIDVDSRDGSVSDCRSCDGLAAVPYTGSVEFSRPVSHLKVFHVWGDGADETELVVSESLS